MRIEPTKIQDCYLIEPKVFQDARGYFMETFSQKEFEAATGLSGVFVQDNQSYSSYGVIRGLHLQKPPFEQAKLVRAVTGTILDVVVDYRQGSASYGQWMALELSGDNHLQLYLPKGCLHGFSVLSEDAVVAYKTDAFFAPGQESGVHFADPFLDIDWQIPVERQLVSEKDQLLPKWEAGMV